MYEKCVFRLANQLTSDIVILRQVAIVKSHVNCITARGENCWLAWQKEFCTRAKCTTTTTSRRNVRVRDSVNAPLVRTADLTGRLGLPTWRVARSASSSVGRARSPGQRLHLHFLREPVHRGGATPTVLRRESARSQRRCCARERVVRERRDLPVISRYIVLLPGER